MTYPKSEQLSDREIAMARRIEELERLNRALISALKHVNEGK